MIELVLPELDLPGIAVHVTAWHAATGQYVVEGDRIVEVAAGDVAVDLSAPATGTLVERCVKIDDLIEPGQVLARIRRG